MQLLRHLALFLCTTLTTVFAHAVEVGDAAPDFALAGSDGQVHRLSELRGQYVVLAFFPKAYTKG